MKTDRILFYTTCFLVAIGIVFSLSLSVFTVLLFDYSHLHFFIRQFIVGSFGIFLMWVLSKINPYKFLTPLCLFMFLSMLFLMIIMPFLPSSIVREVNGAARWIRLSGFSFAPVEFFKIGFIYFLAWSFTRKIGNFKKTFGAEIMTLMPYIVVFMIIIYIIGVLQNDLGQIVVLGLVLIFMVLLAGTSFKIFIFGVCLVAFVVVLAINTSEHRIDRIMSWWAGSQDIVLSFLPDDIASRLQVEGGETPYQVSHSINAINNGGFFGEGIGLGTFKLGFLSEVHTDFVLAGIAEEMGFVGICFVVGLFFILLYRIFKIGERSQNKVYYLFCMGIALMFLFTMMINGYGITSLIPIKGIAVPFLSYGGSHLLAACTSIGLILMISKYSKLGIK
ncbi:FtsW/RodA/SpoVE family cell cycle protein [Campylobacter corcagiensis]|uniref:Probable peptidoglycan glycosyltransferase FtsW n=1 Tax=Campylobacter corcagiensis TaxID=1448857 RepID=A0A7M1LI95_9BACT|nr:putative peptidoglycan glycosyltransferase FtsW [Campylobacter corcagiensis]QKF64613.1 cell division protein, FtsW/RodA/SpoVE family [Campylobacter corcagiensis]QOQ87215.1 cell division protein FtsW [Campylobacter corcagiensis]